MTARVRLVGWNVQPVLMVDDGEDLTPVNVGAIQIPAKEWDKFKNGGDEQALAELRQQASKQLLLSPETAPASTDGKKARSG